jgi:hypothetical protein
MTTTQLRAEQQQYVCVLLRVFLSRHTLTQLTDIYCVCVCAQKVVFI